MIKKFMYNNIEQSEQRFWNHIIKGYDKKVYSRLARKLRLERTLKNIRRPISNIFRNWLRMWFYCRLFARGIQIIYWHRFFKKIDRLCKTK